MDFKEQILECKAQALNVINMVFADEDLEKPANDLLDMLPVQIYSTKEAQEQFEA